MKSLAIDMGNNGTKGDVSVLEAILCLVNRIISSQRCLWKCRDFGLDIALILSHLNWNPEGPRLLCADRQPIMPNYICFHSSCSLSHIKTYSIQISRTSV